jgi:hypothetical protein
MNIATNIPIRPPTGPEPKKNSTISLPVEYPPAIITD